MHDLDVGRLAKAIQWISSHHQFLMTDSKEKGLHVSITEHAELIEEVRFVETTASKLDLDGLAKSATRLLAVLARGAQDDTHVRFTAVDKQVLEGHLSAVLTRAPDDLGGRLALVLPSGKTKLYEPPAPLFGAAVDTKFKRKARREISEAGKCMALGRHTACVFHLMRTVEVAIESIRVCLQLPAPTKGQHKAWGAVLERLRQEIERREKLDYAHQWSSPADKKFFEEVYMALVAIKDGCRDDTMHVESDYNEDEAEHLFAIAKGFMQKVASRLDEDGQPLA
jgi:hypothetical protein